MKKEVVDKIVERIMRQVLKNDYSQDIINSLSELYDLSREAYLPDEEETMEEMEKRHEKQKARLYLAFLIQDLLFEKNPYEEKQLIKNSQILTRWFEYYKININFVTKDEIDTF